MAVKNVTVTMQISIESWLIQRRDDAVADWEEWRDAQYESDEHKQAIDDVFSAYIEEIDNLIAQMVPF